MPSKFAPDVSYKEATQEIVITWKSPEIPDNRKSETIKPCLPAIYSKLPDFDIWQRCLSSKPEIEPRAYQASIIYSYVDIEKDLHLEHRIVKYENGGSMALFETRIGNEELRHIIAKKGTGESEERFIHNGKTVSVDFLTRHKSDGYNIDTLSLA